ncbi:pilus assembly protein PilP [Ectothiorhodospira mobilis]|uniref:pilus assembly protein PilP n=1 Tax=Ectothiorhodospira mobilis TaxID=195064 RepID=UPI001EE8D5B3|nr:pilus assembly protein PilP [Ectothiorhodospira mobilis]MCG5534641.1 pilus assembly protein PilP [Ectothiorhodospira mobilis]
MPDPKRPAPARYRPRAAAACLLTALLAGCGQDLSDLEAYAERIKQRPGGGIEPIPEVEPHETFTYPGHERDPFDPSAVEAEVDARPGAEEDGVSIDPDRPKEFLEQFPLDSLRMVGTLEQDGTRWALIRTPEGVILRVREGNYMGQNHGRIEAITPASIRLTEIVPDGFGGYKERETTVALSE